jgi:hypothetical protein
MVGIFYRTNFAKRGGKYHSAGVNQVFIWCFSDRFSGSSYLGRDEYLSGFALGDVTPRTRRKND